MRSVEELAVAFHRACEAVDVPYAYVGGIAVLAWGQPRSTADIDTLLDVDAEDASDLAEALEGEDLTLDPRDLRDAFDDDSHVTVLDARSPFHVDVKLALTTEEKREVRDAVEVPLDAGPVRIAPAEDTVAYKLHFGTPQDLQDARSILVRQAGRLDLDRLRDVAERLGVDEVLRRELQDLEGEMGRDG